MAVRTNGPTIVMLATVGAVLGIGVALVLAAALTIFEIEVNSGIVGAIAGAVAGTITPLVANRIRSEG